MNHFGQQVGYLLLATGGSILFLAVLFWPLEAAFPAKPGQKWLRPRWLTDLCFLLGQYLIFNGLVFYLVVLFDRELGSLVPGAWRETIRLQPLWLQGLEVIVLSDLCVYWGHRLQHAMPLLWRFHSIHHSAEHLDWLAAHREHPLDTVYTLSLINLPAFIFGFDLSAVMGLIAFRGLWAIYIHSNVRLPIGPLRMLIGAPELHHWHHDRARDAGNYANISPLMDLLFGTYRCPDHEPTAFGIREEISPTYLGQLLHPFLPAKRATVALAPVKDEPLPVNSDCRSLASAAVIQANANAIAGP